MLRKSFVNYMKDCAKDRDSYKGAIARTVLQKVNKEGRRIESLPDLLIWLEGTFVCGQFTTSRDLYKIWQDYLSACGNADCA